MRLLCIEARKLWTQKSILSLFLIVVIANFGLLCYQQLTQPIPISAYDKLQQDLMRLPNEKRYDYVQTYRTTLESISVLQQLQTLNIDPVGNRDMISYLQGQYPDLEKNYGQASTTLALKYTSSLELETALLQELDEEFQILHAYHETQSQIQEKASSITNVSIFSSQDSFSNRNILKSANDFKNMEALEPIYQVQKPIIAALQFPFTDLMIVLMGIGIVSAMVLDEKQKGLLVLLRTTIRGDIHTMIAKSMVMMLSMGVVSLVLCSSNLLLMHGLCRIGDLFAPLISLANFSLTTLPFSILEFFFIFLCTKWLSACVIGGLMLFTAIITKHKLGCFVWIIVTLGIEWLLFVLCELQGPFAIFKQLNLIAFLDTASLYERYMNLNVLGTPMTYHICALWLLVSLIVLFVFLTCLSFHKLQDVSLQQVRIPSWLQKMNQKHKLTTSLFLQETYKVLWVQKGCFLLLGYLCIVCMYQHHQTLIFSQDERAFAQYTAQMEQKTPKEIEDFFHSQKAYFASLHKQCDEIDQQYDQGTLTRQKHDQLIGPLDVQLSNEPIFQMVQERYAYAMEDEHRAFLNPFGYEQLFMNEETWLIPWCIVLVSLVLLLSDLVCIEYQNDAMRLISTTRKGRTRLFFHKLGVASCITAALMFITILVVVVRISNAYELTAIHASASSLPQFAHIPSSISLFTLFLFDIAMKFLSCMVIIGTLMVLSHHLKQMRAVLCMVCLLFFIPILLHMMGLSMFDFLSVAPLMTATYELTQADLVPLYSATLFALLVSAFTLTHAYKSFIPTT